MMFGELPEVEVSLEAPCCWELFPGDSSSDILIVTHGDIDLESVQSRKHQCEVDQ